MASLNSFEGKKVTQMKQGADSLDIHFSDKSHVHVFNRHTLNPDDPAAFENAVIESVVDEGIRYILSFSGKRSLVIGLESDDYRRRESILVYTPDGTLRVVA